MNNQNLFTGVDIIPSFRTDGQVDYSDRINCDYYRLANSINICIKSNLTEFSQQFKKLYASFRVGKGSPVGLTYSVLGERKNGSSAPVYSIFRGRRLLYRSTDYLVLLPYLDFYINSDILDRLNQFFQVHASVLAKEEKGLMFPGASGSGKTTLITALLLKGFKYVSDDLAFIYPGSHKVEPFPKGLCLKEGSFDLFPSLKARINPTEYHSKPFRGKLWYLSPEEISPNSLGKISGIDYLIFMQYDPSKGSELIEITKAKAVMELLKRSYNFMHFGEKGIDLLTRLVKAAQCFYLTTNQLPEAVAFIIELVANGRQDSSLS